MKFRNKILLAIWGVVLLLLLITSVIIRYWTGVQVESRSGEELRSNHTTIRELNALRSEEIMKSAEVVAATPRLMAVVDLGDRNTALQIVDELNRSIVSDLFLLTDSHGRWLARIIDGKESPVSPGDTALLFRGNLQESQPRIRQIGRSVYRCATAPVVVGPDRERVGTLTVGFRFEQQDLDAIKAMTNSDIVLLVGDTVILSTLSPASQSKFIAWLQHSGRTGSDSSDLFHTSGKQPSVVPIQTVSDNYLATVVLLDNGAAPGVPVSFVVLKSVGLEIESALKPVFDTFIILSLLVLLLTALLGYVISQGITRPIAALVRGTAEISRGNYDYNISVGSDAELKYLAERFQEMSNALKDKMSQLAERNAEVEGALQQLKAMQAELVKSERLAATGKLTAQLSHEINNPVHNIQSCLQTLMKRLRASAENEREVELLDVALEEVDRLAKLTRQMLDVYRTTIVPIEREPVMLNDVVTEVITTSRDMLAKQNIRVALSLASSLPPIRGSKDKLKQVFLNLFLNARDAMPQGGTLTIETHKQDGYLIVKVADTGVGISPENINKIFDAFFTTKSTVSGVGLGLSVTYGIIRQHDGTISVQSTLGEGTVFNIQLPVQ